MRIYFRAVSTCKDSSLLFAVNAKDGVIVNTTYVIAVIMKVIPFANDIVSVISHSSSIQIL